MELKPHNGTGNRYSVHLSAPHGGSVQMLRDPEGNWVSYEDYQRKFTQVQNLMDLVGSLMVELDDTKDRLERLTEKSKCQTECLNAFDKKLNEAQHELVRLRISTGRLLK